ncbi:hypothetical protein BU16DRAFT_366553 [Lophium mytilinum]|uniref:Uncharacterized protein n=1 Tax=Lophium mytilinum TaxID=390894 RepID=A0A6A6QWN0_9PEZI|nr:hypothetical protein BU16DRAFT_366553 [Lophium mytilinum]
MQVSRARRSRAPGYHPHPDSTSIQPQHRIRVRLNVGAERPSPLQLVRSVPLPQNAEKSDVEPSIARRPFAPHGVPLFATLAPGCAKGDERQKLPCGCLANPKYEGGICVAAHPSSLMPGGFSIFREPETRDAASAVIRWSRDRLSRVTVGCANGQWGCY